MLLCYAFLPEQIPILSVSYSYTYVAGLHLRYGLNGYSFVLHTAMHMLLSCILSPAFFVTHNV